MYIDFHCLVPLVKCFYSSMYDIILFDAVQICTPASSPQRVETKLCKLSETSVARVLFVFFVMAQDGYTAAPQARQGLVDSSLS